MTPPTVGLNEDGPLRRPLPGRLESHDADPGLDRRDRPREARWDRTRRLCRRRPTCSIVDREAGLHGHGDRYMSPLRPLSSSTRWGMPPAACTTTC